MTWRRPPRPLALDHLFFGEQFPEDDAVDQDFSLGDRFLTALMWVSLAFLALIFCVGAIVGLFLLGSGWGVA